MKDCAFGSIATQENSQLNKKKMQNDDDTEFQIKHFC